MQDADFIEVMWKRFKESCDEYVALKKRLAHGKRDQAEIEKRLKMLEELIQMEKPPENKGAA
jgi:hypothetical protein